VWSHDVCAILKLYLRELPEGLIPATKWLPLFDSSEDSNLDKIYDMLMELPPFNMLVLFKIFHLLDNIIANEDVTKMSITNLAVCLSPCILPSHDPVTELMDLNIVQKSQKVFVQLIHSWRSISERMQTKRDRGSSRKIAQSEKDNPVSSDINDPTILTKRSQSVPTDPNYVPLISFSTNLDQNTIPITPITTPSIIETSQQDQQQTTTPIIIPPNDDCNMTTSQPTTLNPTSV